MGVRVIKSSEYKWRRLDNSAKIFPAASGLETSNVFRLSCVLNEDAEPNLLQQALEYTIKQFPAFNVRMHSGFFWYYFDANKKTPTVMHESMYPCAPMNRHENDGFLFRVLYHKKRISLETYHALTDGTGGLEFLCAIVTAYLTLKNGKQLPRHGTAEADGYKNASAVEDCYNKIYDKSAAFSPFGEKAYRIRGKRLPYTMTRIVSGELSASGLLAAAREKGVTLTAYLTALIIYSIYMTCLGGKPEKKAVSVSLPVNLRSIFKEKSALNFFACVSAGLTFEKEGTAFDEVLAQVKAKMEKEINEDYLTAKNAYNVKTERNPFVRAVPLVIKNAVLRSAHKQGELADTTAFSNLGRIVMPPELEGDIEKFEFILSPTENHLLKCSACTYGDRLVFTFSTSAQECEIQQFFFSFLAQLGLKVQIEANYILDDKDIMPEKQSVRRKRALPDAEQPEAEPVTSDILTQSSAPEPKPQAEKTPDKKAPKLSARAISKLRKKLSKRKTKEQKIHRKRDKKLKKIEQKSVKRLEKTEHKYLKRLEALKEKARKKKGGR